MAQITQLSLYIINRVKVLRLILGIPASRLSVFLNHTPAYVFNVEKASLTTQYPPNEWPKLAEGLNCEVHDLMPPDEMDQTSTGQFVDKKVLSLSVQDDVKLVINGLKDFGFFNYGKTLEETAQHLFINEHLQKTLLEQTMNQVVHDEALSKNVSLYQKI